MKKIIFIFLTIFCHISNAQVQIEDLIRSSIESGDIEIKEKTILYTSGSTLDPTAGELDFLPVNLLLNDLAKDSLDQYSILGNLTFSNCTFPQMLILSNLKFSGVLRFSNCKFPKGVILRNITADKIQFKENLMESLQIENLITYSFSIELDEVNDWISISESTFKNQVSIDVQNKIVSLDITGNTFMVRKPTVLLNHPELFYHGKPSSNFFMAVNADNVMIEKNDFKAFSEFDIFTFTIPDADKISIALNNCEGFFELNGKSNFFRMYGNTFNKIGIRSFSFPEFETSIEWNNISGNRLGNKWSRNDPKDFGISDSLMTQYYAQMDIINEADAWTPEFYFGQTDRELESKWFFDHLISDYYRIYQSYKVKGRIDDANNVYVELNELYGRRLGAIYHKEPSFRGFLKWKLNRLLKLYTEHGTEPIKAIIISFYIIMFFGVFYFFFPSKWDELEWKKKKWQQFSKIKTVKVLFIHLLNSMTLSLNAFVTLGFGNIPTSGIPRYVCVIQGFIGWFLLSLFTVALINQTLF